MLFFARLVYPRFTLITLCCSTAVIASIGEKIFAYKMNNNEIVTDGRIITTVRDPPGQYSTYITPGDTRMELYRITTFQKFPSHAPINPCNLANNGFFYTGYKDRVKCFDCAQAVDNWTITDDPLSVAWHRTDCQMITRHFTSNVPLTAMISMNTQTTSHNNRSNNLQNSPAAITSPPPPSSEGHTTTRDSPAHSTREIMFPCNNPVNPCMRNPQKRLDTFYERARNWPRDRLTATPADMANAGLYYLGTHDRVKCFYCNGGLQNWDTYDEPWFEHAKWFPHCEFLLQQKGLEYVERVKNRFPNLSRPNLNNSISISATSNRRTSNSPTIIDPAEKHQQICTKVETEINSSPIIQDAIQMGFSSEAIRHAFYDQFTAHNKPFTTLSALVQALLDQPDTLSHTHTQNPYTTLSSEKAQTPQQELHRLKQQRQCKRCCAATATVVCLPCGHLAICKDCSTAITRCPVCMTTISKKIATYIA